MYLRVAEGRKLPVGYVVSAETARQESALTSNSMVVMILRTPSLNSQLALIMSTNYMYELQLSNLANHQCSICYWRKQHIYTYLVYVAAYSVENVQIYIPTVTVGNLDRPTQYVLSTPELRRSIGLTEHLAQMGLIYLIPLYLCFMYRHSVPAFSGDVCPPTSLV